NAAGTTIAALVTVIYAGTSVLSHNYVEPGLAEALKNRFHNVRMHAVPLQVCSDVFAVLRIDPEYLLDVGVCLFWLPQLRVGHRQYDVIVDRAGNACSLRFDKGFLVLPSQVEVQERDDPVDSGLTRIACERLLQKREPSIPVPGQAQPPA